MATDYDSPRKTDDDLTEDSLQELQARRMDKSSSTIDLDPDDVAVARLTFPGFLARKEQHSIVGANSLGDNHAGIDRG